MSLISRRILLAGAATLAAALSFAGTASARDLVIGYQTTVEPSKVAQAAGAYEAALGTAIDWRKFDSGADVIAAIASGDVDIGYVGSSPLAAAASRELPIQTIFVVGIIGAFIGGLIVSGGSINNAPLNVTSFLVSLVGAVILLAIVNLVRRGRVR